MHANIERICEYAKIYTPKHWMNIVRMARKTGRLYDVHELIWDDFLECKKFASEKIGNFKSNDGSVSKWKLVVVPPVHITSLP